jgi:hypothetical protein
MYSLFRDTGNYRVRTSGENKAKTGSFTSPHGPGRYLIMLKKDEIIAIISTMSGYTGFPFIIRAPCCLTKMR